MTFYWITAISIRLGLIHGAVSSAAVAVRSNGKTDPLAHRSRNTYFQAVYRTSLLPSRGFIDSIFILPLLAVSGAEPPIRSVGSGRVLVAQSCPTLYWSRPGSSVHSILQARALEWIQSFPSPWGSSWPKDWTPVSCIAGRFWLPEPPGKSLPGALKNTKLCIDGSVPPGAWMRISKRGLQSHRGVSVPSS